jgi:hypothetical protein
MKNYEIYYPAALTETKQVYPAMFEHLASWGFIVIGNEDPGTGTMNAMVMSRPGCAGN